MPDETPGEASEKPWVASGNCIPRHEDYLIGNRAGLQLLKDSIDRALANQECRIEEGGIEFIGVREMPEDPRSAKTGKRGVKDAVALWGCALFLILVALVFFAGLVQLYSWLKP